MIGTDSKKSNIGKWYSGYEFAEIHDFRCSDGSGHIQGAIYKMVSKLQQNLNNTDLSF